MNISWFLIPILLSCLTPTDTQTTNGPAVPMDSTTNRNPSAKSATPTNSKCHLGWTWLVDSLANGRCYKPFVYPVVNRVEGQKLCETLDAHMAGFLDSQIGPDNLKHLVEDELKMIKYLGLKELGFGQAGKRNGVICRMGAAAAEGAGHALQVEAEKVSFYEDLLPNLSDLVNEQKAMIDHLRLPQTPPPGMHNGVLCRRNASWCAPKKENLTCLNIPISQSCPADSEKLNKSGCELGWSKIGEQCYKPFTYYLADPQGADFCQNVSAEFLVFFDELAKQPQNVSKVADEQLAMVEHLKLTKAGMHSGVMCRKAASLCAPPKLNLTCPAYKKCIDAYPADVVLLFDSSGSINDTDFNGPIKNFAKDLAKALNVSDSGNHMGILAFSSNVTRVRYLDDDVPLINTQIDQMRYRGYGTNMSSVLVEADRMLSGGQGRKKNKTVMLITDGEPHMKSGVKDPEEMEKTLEAARDLRARNVTIITLGVGIKSNATFLNQVTGSPYNTYIVENFDKLNFAQDFICQDGGK